MIENERLSKIMDILEREKFCTTEYLSNTLYVVPVTVRRDLKKLEQRGLINRCYGGASIISRDDRSLPFVVRKNLSNKIKAELAREAVGLIRQGSTVFLDSSSTASYIAELITADMGVSVITNSLRSALILSEKNVETYCIGGHTVENSYSLVGSLALNSISSLYADIMFFSSQAINYDGDITDFSEADTQVRRQMLEHSDKKYFVCDDSKIGKTCLFSVCNASQLDGVICNKKTEFVK